MSERLPDQQRPVQPHPVQPHPDQQLPVRISPGRLRAAKPALEKTPLARIAELLGSMVQDLNLDRSSGIGDTRILPNKVAFDHENRNSGRFGILFCCAAQQSCTGA
jgi:hypothetical protein